MPVDDPPKLHKLVRDIAGRLARADFGTGPLAELRRMDPRAPTAPAFFRLLAELPGQGPLDRRRWALLIHILALAAPDRLGGRDELGASLFEAGCSEGRLTRLLQARDEDLADVMPRTVRFLAARGQTLNPTALAYFVGDIGIGGEAAERARDRIARAYYKAEYAAANSTQQPSRAN